MSASKIVNCLVCGVQTTLSYRLGALICEPCKRFFIRHRNNCNNLVCETGQNQCQVNVTQRHRNAYTTYSGMTYRFACTKCRFEKCLSVGVGASHRRAVKVRSMPSNRSIPTPTIPDQDFLNAERTWTSLVPLSQKFLFDLNSKRRNLQETILSFLQDTTATWRYVMAYFQDVLFELKSFALQLPGFQNIAVVDRCSLVARSVIKLTVVEACYHEQFGHNSFVSFFQYIPQCIGQHLLPSLHNIAELLKDWHLDHVELAFLLAFIFFYETTNEWNSFVDRRPFDEAVQLLRHSYSVYMLRVEAADVRRQKMQQALELFEMYNRQCSQINVALGLEQFPQLKAITPGSFIEVCERLRQFPMPA